jgi:4-hydroxy-tetrahydrodipicolinate synthase
MTLQGCFTAIVTPFKDGRVDWDAFRNLIAKQVEGGVDGILPVGTTGESPTLEMDEHKKVIETTIECTAGKCRVIAGTGANSTKEALELTLFAKQAGADATLQVTPYYNKPSQEGLYRHFSTIADETGLPVMLYNVPGRSALEISIDTIKRLSSNTNVVAVKEAGGSVDRVSQILSCCNITVLSGDDTLTLPMMSVGAKGVVSVASNVLPAEVTEYVHLALEGQWTEARIRHFRLYDFFSKMFIDTNPIPVKAALAMLGQIEEEYRLPICSMSDEAKATLRETMRTVGLPV